MQQHKITSEKQIVVKDSSTEDIFGSACSNALITGMFADFGIVADVGPNGDGNVTAGPFTFSVHENPQYSGGITCYRMYNDNESSMVCDDIPLPSTVQLDPVKVDDISPCFSDQVDMTLQRAAEAVHVMDTFPMPRREANSPDAVSMRNLEQQQTGRVQYVVTRYKESWRRRSPSEPLAETVGRESIMHFPLVWC